MQCIEIVGHNPDKPQNSGWGASARMTYDWMTGGGAANRHYDGSTSSAQNMMSARRVNEARAFFYKKNADALANGKPLESVTNYKGKFWLDDIVRSGLNPTQQFIGSYGIDITPVGDNQIKFDLSNNSSWKSFFYGIGTDHERDSRPAFGNMRQTYSWTEELKK